MRTEIMNMVVLLFIFILYSFPANKLDLKKKKYSFFIDSFYFFLFLNTKALTANKDATISNDN